MCRNARTQGFCDVPGFRPFSPYRGVPYSGTEPSEPVERAGRKENSRTVLTMMATCVECDQTFTAKRPNASCCSPPCRKAKSRRSGRMRSVGNARETRSTMDRASAPGPASEGPGVTDNRGGHLTLILRPHIEHRNGWRFHLDRFDAYLNGELILTSRQPWYDAARELLRRGYPATHCSPCDTLARTTIALCPSRSGTSRSGRSRTPTAAGSNASAGSPCRNISSSDDAERCG